MNTMEPMTAHCPYCGEAVELMVDCSIGSQRYVEDCSVCCRPIDVAVRMPHGDGVPELALYRQDDA